MKKTIGRLFVVLLLISALPQVALSSQVKSDAYTIENSSLPESINYILGTSAGINMLNLIESKAGNFDLDNGKTIILPNAEATLFKGSKKNGARYDLAWISLPNKGNFLFGVETSLNPFNLLNSYVKLYTVSGKVVLFENMEVKILNSNYSFQNNDDVANSIQVEGIVHSTVDTCTILLILGILSGGLLLIAYLLTCL